MRMPDRLGLEEFIHAFERDTLRLTRYSSKA